ncbi:MAG: M14 family metallopeptidase [Acidobacteriota bacterium]
MNRTVCVSLALLITLVAFGAPLTASAPLLTLSDYLPDGVLYDDAIPKPADVLGFEPGEWHIRPDQLVEYARAVAAASDRVTVEIQGRSHERRPQPLLTVTSPANHAGLERLRLAHLAVSADGALDEPLESMPLVVLQGFSIHGNEPSGANAVPLLLYHLAAARSDEVEGLLERTVILIDPSMNPDGIGRFAHWANTNRGHRVTPDTQHREYREPWPGGRTNHYFFDLNRDWLLAQHPESRNRLRTFHRWRPNVLTDHHEMGTGSTFFFQPGVPSRKNPRIPERNVELTNAMAEFHAAAFDEADRLYYTQEGFDDFYPGKGSTYPDLHGSVGILFEQASSRGHAQRRLNDVLTFPFTIENQFRAALSTLAGADANRLQLMEHQRDFFRKARADAEADRIRGFLVEAHGDRGRLRGFLDVLAAHQIDSFTASGDGIDSATSIVVPTSQPQYVLIRSLFDRLTEFTDSTFYDVSTWNLPMAFGLDYRSLDAAELSSLTTSEKAEGGEGSASEMPDGDGIAYALDWTDSDAAKVLGRLLEQGVEARVATRPLTAETTTGSRDFGAGTVLLPRRAGSGVEEALAQAIAGTDVQPALLTTGWTPSGPDLGSNQTQPIERPSVLLVVDRPTRSYAAGEIWHLLDRRFEIPVSLVNFSSLTSADLSEYTHIFMPDGSYSVSDALRDKLEGFMRQGGFLVGTQGGAHWIDSGVRRREDAATETEVAGSEERPVYGDYRSDRAKQLVSGAIFEIEMDLTHPLAWGYHSAKLPVFRTSTRVLSESANPYLDVAFYTDAPRLSGYATQNKIDAIAGTVAIAAGRYGGGGWIQIVDNPAFRAIWWGPSRLVLNSLFFAQTLQFTSPPTTWE